MADTSLIYNRFQEPLSNPQVSLSIVGPTGTTTHTYLVTAINECGETDGTQVSTSTGPDSLSLSNYIQLSWPAVDRARKYRVYKDVGGSWGLLAEIEDTSYDDTGADAPDTNVTPPSTNETEGYLVWDRVVIIPGRDAQSAEINEIQEIVAYYLKQLGDAFFKDGDIIKGCILTVNQSKTQAQIDSGYMYLYGAIRYVNGATLTITGSGTEYVGVNVSIRYIDENDNEHLLDPAQNYPGYGEPGAYRRIVDAQWVVDTDDSAIDVVVWKLEDGEQTLYREPPQYSVLDKVFARRLNDFHGPTLIEGFPTRFYPHSTRRDQVVLEIGPGKAYVGGYEITKPSVTKLIEDIAKDTQNASEEVPVKSGYLYAPDHTPIAQVNKVTIRVKVAETRTVPSTQDSCGWLFDDTGESIDVILGVWSDSSKTTAYTFSNTDPGCAGRDANTYKVYLSGTGFALDPNTFSSGNSYYIEYLKFQIVTKGVRQKAYQEDTFTRDASVTTYNLSKTDPINSTKTPVVVVDENNVTYVEGTDYTFDDGRTDTSIGTASITFLSGKGPADGVEFYIKYHYWDHVTEGDYVSVDSYLDDTDPYQDYTYDDIEYPNYVDFRTSSSVKPASENTDIIVDYDFFLPQIGMLLLNANGDFYILRGDSSIRPVAPSIPEGELPRYKIRFPAFDQTLDLYEDDRYEVMTTFRLNVLEDRVANTEYNLALTALEQEAMARHTINPKKGLLTDSFRTTEVYDPNATNASMELNKGNLIPHRYWEPLQGSWDLNNSTNIASRGRSFLLTYTEALYDSQLLWTEDFAQDVNPYDAYGPFTSLFIFPRVDFWVTEDTEYEIISSYRTVDEGWANFHHNYSALGGSWSTEGLRNYVAQKFNIDPTIITIQKKDFSNGAEALATWDTYLTQVVGVQTVGEEFIPYLRQRPVYLYIRGCLPNEDNISATFDGQSVNLSLATQAELDALGLDWTATGSTGTNAGTVKADSNGEVVAKFTIPANIPAGQREIVVTAPSGLVWASAQFFGLGMVKHLRETVEKIKVHHIYWLNQSPLAQSFTVKEPEGVFITSISYWVYRVPSDTETTAGLKTAIRGMSDDNYPTGTVYAEKTLSKSEIMSMMGISDPSETLDNPTDANKVTFTFDEPVYLPPGEYCFTIEDMAPGYYVYVARVNKKILGKVGDANYSKIGENLTWQAHGGMMFISANNKTWEVDQATDIMFEIKRAEFSVTQGSLRVTLPNGSHQFSHFLHYINDRVPPQTSVLCRYRVGTGSWSPYLPIVGSPNASDEAQDLQPIGQMVDGSDLQLELILLTQSSKVSPVINKDLNVLYAYYHEGPSTYRTQEVDLSPESFSYLTVWVDEKLNQGTVTYEVSFDSGNTWYTLSASESQDLPGGFTEKTLGGSLDTITSNAVSSASKFIIRITLNNATYRYLYPVLRRLRVVVY